MTGTPLPSSGIIYSVAISAGGEGLLGGEDYNSGAAVAFTVTPAGVARAVTGGPLPPHGFIYSVAISAAGEGLLGGEDLYGSSRCCVHGHPRRW